MKLNNYIIVPISSTILMYLLNLKILILILKNSSNNIHNNKNELYTRNDVFTDTTKYTRNDVFTYTNELHNNKNELHTRNDVFTDTK